MRVRFSSHVTLPVFVGFVMEDEAFTDINGKSISLDCQSHSSLCSEFIVSVPKVSIGKVMVYTCCVWLLAYAVFFFTEVRQMTE